MKLVVVESPTKAKTLTRFLNGQGFVVEATYGHVRDLPEKKLGVDVTHKFEPEYVQNDKQKDRSSILKKEAATASDIYLATDPDREGEAIAWHVAELIKSEKAKGLKRIVFHEITKPAIEEALAHPKEVDMKLVNAQQARRVLDRLVGYKISPLLWRKVRKGLSAGRVQSVAVRLIVEREKEIEAFVPTEYWNIFAITSTAKKAVFKVQLAEKNGEKFQVKNGQTAEAVEGELRGADYTVGEVNKKEMKKTPPPPFTTSTMQQAAANRMGWSAKKTMQVAQNLYEEGYITYHRTDSTNLATEAVTAVRNYIEHTWGREFALASPRLYKTKSKVAQEAHEAIRPTDPTITSGQVGQLGRDAQKLYELIWKRYVACQMAEAKGFSLKVMVQAKASANTYSLEAKGETISFPGFMKLYDSGVKIQETENGEEKMENSEKIPELAEGEKLDLVELNHEQKFTQPPARYNDAGLIKALEEMGIGRPSTYAPIISTIQDRQYVERVEKRFKPTALGVAVNDFLIKNFAGIVDYQFTAKMEDELDEVANGQREWQPMMSEFYTPFEKIVEDVGKTAERVKVETEMTGDKCPKCGIGDVVVRVGKYGKFLSCSRYPECDYRATFQNKTGIACPKCDGEVILKHTKSRKSFYGCSNYPKCDFASWTKPHSDTAATEQQPPAAAAGNTAQQA